VEEEEEEGQGKNPFDDDENEKEKKEETEEITNMLQQSVGAIGHIVADAAMSSAHEEEELEKTLESAAGQAKLSLLQSAEACGTNGADDDDDELDFGDDDEKETKMETNS